MKILVLFLVLLALSSFATSKKNGKSKSNSAHKKVRKVEKNKGPIDDFINPPNAVKEF